MVVLKKIKASSLNEVLVATIIIVVVFGIAIATLNNVMQNVLQRNTKSIQAKLNEVVYQYPHGNFKLPYSTTDGDWEISISQEKGNTYNRIVFEVTSKRTNKTITRKQLTNEKD